MDKNTAHTVVKVVAVLYWIGALFGIIGAVASLFGITFLGAFFPAGDLATALLSVIGVFLLAVAVLEIFVGYGLWKLKNWARITVIVLGAIGLILFPIGTIFGIVVIYFFGFNKDIKALF